MEGEQPAIENSSRGCVMMVVGAVVLLLGLMLYAGAEMNKTGTGLVEPVLGVIGAVVLVVGVVRRIQWVRGGD